MVLASLHEMEEIDVLKLKKRAQGAKNMKKLIRPRQDSNLQSSDPKSDALSIRPRGRHTVT